jgi:nicotinate-nucleotide pyrophosphorylase (carboxylating)
MSDRDREGYRAARPVALDPAADALVRLAVEEDLAGPGDVTSRWTVPEEAVAVGRVVARGGVVVSGLPLAAAVLTAVDHRAVFLPQAEEGTELAPGGVLAELHGPARSLLTAERTLLNFLIRLSAVATYTRRFVEAVAGTGVVVVDTRKTTAGLRFWEKRAVRHGGGGNHRFGLFDLVLIKDNHLLVAGGVSAAVERARAVAPPMLKIEVEVEDEGGLRAALDAGADLVMLDNMDPGEMARLVALARSRRPEVLLEASGGVTLETVRVVAGTGVDFISVGALTSFPPPVDLGLDFEEV